MRSQLVTGRMTFASRSLQEPRRQMMAQAWIAHGPSVAAAEPAGLAAEVSAHWLRHAHASHSLDRGAPIHLVQQTLGHASVATTGATCTPDPPTVQPGISAC